MKSRKKWLITRDLNTIIFIYPQSFGDGENAIEFLKDETNGWLNSRNAIGNHIVLFFQELYKTSNPTIPSDLEGLIDPLVSDSKNKSLCVIPNAEEVLAAVQQIGSHKAGGPDCMSTLFFKHFWLIIGTNVVSMVSSFFTTGHMLRAMNHTNIALIPKIENPPLIRQYRPISLCNVTYKIMAKTLANRLRPVLPKLVSRLQATFVPGRTIQENSVMAHELFHVMKQHRRAKQFMAIRAYIEKAYDRMVWPLILIALWRFGFHEIFVGWVEQCLSTSSFSILFNGSPFGLFSPSRGLRQGDSLSPFLYIIGSEVFSCMLLKAKVDGCIHGLRIS
ncbi:hypothetical protein CJ030_MR3G001074 [Morella rubra]|uniref:Reverse transcriptase domain-containing protein n=1 Tax=Morella rubra TaxID=262757 RepID=A0A6A1W3G4_9ROSI|nr:hypothetical protein CJ030_MR3G001074 [Morella rubra]